MILPVADSGAMQLHLDEIAQNVTRGWHGIVVIDGAGWHKSEELKIPKNITLIKLPPYSPELNPMERVWEELRKLRLSNTYYDSYDEIDQACVETWNNFISKKGNIKKLCTRKWASIS